MAPQFHPEADLFPLLTGEAFQDLVVDIQKNGLREPILLDASATAGIAISLALWRALQIDARR